MPEHPDVERIVTVTLEAVRWRGSTLLVWVWAFTAWAWAGLLVLLYVLGALR